MDDVCEIWLGGRLWPNKREKGSKEVRLEEIMRPLLNGLGGFPKILETENPQVIIRLGEYDNSALTNVSDRMGPVYSSLTSLIRLYDRYHDQQSIGLQGLGQEKPGFYELDFQESLKEYWDFHKLITGNKIPNDNVIEKVSRNAWNIGSVKFLSDDSRITLVNV